MSCKTKREFLDRKKGGQMEGEQNSTQTSCIISRHQVLLLTIMLTFVHCKAVLVSRPSAIILRCCLSLMLSFVNYCRHHQISRVFVGSCSCPGLNSISSLRFSCRLCPLSQTGASGLMLIQLLVIITTHVMAVMGVTCTSLSVCLSVSVCLSACLCLCLCLSACLPSYLLCVRFLSLSLFTSFSFSFSFSLSLLSLSLRFCVCLLLFPSPSVCVSMSVFSARLSCWDALLCHALHPEMMVGGGVAQNNSLEGHDIDNPSASYRAENSQNLKICPKYHHRLPNPPAPRS